MATTDEPQAGLSGHDAWRAAYEASPGRVGEVSSTASGVEDVPLATPEGGVVDYERDLGSPGLFPFSRGVYPSMCDTLRNVRGTWHETPVS